MNVDEAGAAAAESLRQSVRRIEPGPLPRRPATGTRLLATVSVIVVAVAGFFIVRSRDVRVDVGSSEGSAAPALAAIDHTLAAGFSFTAQSDNSFPGQAPRHAAYVGRFQSPDRSFVDNGGGDTQYFIGTRWYTHDTMFGEYLCHQAPSPFTQPGPIASLSKIRSSGRVAASGSRYRFSGVASGGTVRYSGELTIAGGHVQQLTFASTSTNGSTLSLTATYADVGTAGTVVAPACTR
jgi:hypothetical protein